MIYSVLSIIVGVISLYFVFKLYKEDDNLWDVSTSFSGLVGSIILIIVGFISLFKGWG
ncbi:hypothetical protein H3Z83_09765 [Tenacibaculum sp. S7007]|uniref:Uncharacterized protein n=1 Tax=Tenacibaculum pelagium TaxID=2759527 RepID=A0A839AQZ6_9FLAO|nr:hypothetical protein [Tenacibaculum pelagium]MBA6156800.1 hypothetical protein [Tenacibaculum pelagium]